MGRRSIYQFGRDLERSAKGNVDTGLGKNVVYGTFGILLREARVSPWWQAVGFTGIFGALFILSFYSVVAGWILDYSTVLAARGFGQFAKEDFGPLFAGCWPTRSS